MNNNNIQIEQDNKAQRENFKRYYETENIKGTMQQSTLNLMYGGNY